MNSSNNGNNGEGDKDVDICLKGVYYASARTLIKGKGAYDDDYYEYQQLIRDHNLTGITNQETALNFVHSTIEIFRILLDTDEPDKKDILSASKLKLEPINIGVILNFMKSIVSASNLLDLPATEGLERDILKAAANLRKETSELWIKYWPAFDTDVRTRLKKLIISHRLISQSLTTEPNRQLRSDAINQLLMQTLDLNWLVGEQTLILRMGLLVLELAFLGTVREPNEHHIKLYILNQLQRVIYSVKQNRTFTMQTTLKFNKVHTKSRSKNATVSANRTDLDLYNDAALQLNKVITAILGPLKKINSQNHDNIPRIYQAVFNPKVAQQLENVRSTLDIEPITLCFLLTGCYPSHIIRFKYYCIQHLKALRTAYPSPNIDNEEIKKFYMLFPKLFDSIVFPKYNEAMSPHNPNNFESFEESQLIHALKALRKMIEFAQNALPKDGYFAGVFDHLKTLIHNEKKKAATFS